MFNEKNEAINNETSAENEVAVTIEATTEVETALELNLDFQINNLAITLLDLEKSSPSLAEKCININPKDHKVFFEFFQEHIEETRNGSNTRECRFSDADNAVLTKINRYKSDKTEENFIKFANEISSTLFDIMKEATRSSGSFFIIDAIYKEEDIIVFIKLDPKNGVQLDLDSLELKEIENMLPESGDRVHKCAIVKTTYVENSTNLFVLDKQQKAGETSKFFMSTFLQALAIPNNKIKTVAVLKELYEKIEAKLPDVDKMIIDSAIEAEFNNGSTVHIPVTVRDIYDKLLPEDTEDRDIVLDEYRNEFVSNYNTKYKDYGNSLVVERDVNTVTYRANSNKIYFKYNKSLEGTEVKVNHDSSKNLYTITIQNNSDIQFNKTVK